MYLQFFLMLVHTPILNYHYDWTLETFAFITLKFELFSILSIEDVRKITYRG